MITQADIEAAAARIQGHVRNTPMLTVEPGGAAPSAVALKLEHLQITGSFKLRGAFNTMLAGPMPTAGVVAASGGNHGAAVAYAATRLGARSTIFVPALIADPVKIARMKRFGAEIVLIEGGVDDVMRAYAAHAERTGALSVHPYDAPPTLAGQGTLGLEIERDAPALDTLLVSVGGGGLIGGIVSWYAGRIRIVAVETEGTNSLAQTLASGRKAQVTPQGIAASALGAQSVGDLPIAAMSAYPVESAVVTDAAVCDAQTWLWEGARLAVEPGAATAMAALTSGIYTPSADERVAVLLCGGNAAPGWFLD
ncbi:MAG: threonine/serine dehydratase [Pseudomonadota bacterium]